MNLLLILAAFCVEITSAASTFDGSLDAHWYRWKANHRKLYGMNEGGWRRAVWEKNMKMIELHNQEYSQGKHGFTMAMNAFGDMTNEEFRQVRNGFQNQKHKKEKFQEPSFLEVPKSVVWREKGYVTPVKNQGSCRAFSATDALEGQMFWKTGKLISLSEQSLVNYSRLQGNEGCKGGLMGYTFQYIKENGGLDSEESYPYDAMDESCKYRLEYTIANDTGFVDVPKEEKTLMKAITIVGPVSVAVDAGQESFQFCKESVYFESDCSSEDVDHGVLVVGYRSEKTECDNNKYWLVKNSWGEEWGLSGYIKMAKDQKNHRGIASSSQPCELTDSDEETLDWGQRVQRRNFILKLTSPNCVEYILESLKIRV
ncbi:procathepsin L-like [Nycticebus coucang]|uniref:procathepsin L-like n=1 Tax=Nycticebus coucang TaxID=9470 RepID=UPI00234C5091|nr:procathepsin L-like [Nycticebus coucang]